MDDAQAVFQPAQKLIAGKQDFGVLLEINPSVRISLRACTVLAVRNSG